MAKKRILNPHVKGGFSPYVQKDLSEGEKKTLTEARRSKDLIQLNKERKLQGLAPIADKKLDQRTREFQNDTELASGSTVVEKNVLSKEEKDKVEAGMSIPEMKALATSKEIKIPAKLKKKADIASFLMNNGKEESDLL